MVPNPPEDMTPGVMQNVCSDRPLQTSSAVDGNDTFRDICNVKIRPSYDVDEQRRDRPQTRGHHRDTNTASNSHTTNTHAVSKNQSITHPNTPVPHTRSTRHDTRQNTTQSHTGSHSDTHVNHTLTHGDVPSYFLYYLSQYFNLVSSVLFYLSAAVNPLLYNLMSARYRRAVHSLIHTHAHTQPAHRLHTLRSQRSTTTL